MLTGSARIFLELTIGKRITYYQCVPLDPHPDVATRAWRLWRSGGKKFYDVAICKRGWITCTCPDSTYRSRPCKHAKALRQAGILTEKA